jgi:hypothetical protein
MPTPAPVVIEMAAADAALPFAQVLVNACSAGLRDRGPCALEDATSSSARAIVIISWESTGHFAAKIEVGLRQGGHADWSSRRVVFNTSDQEIERWRSVGLIVATLVGEATGEKKAEAPPTPPTPPAPLASPPAPPETPGAALPASRVAAEKGAPPPTGTWFFEGAFAMSRGSGDSFGAFGGVARAGRRLAPSWLFVTASARLETQPISYVTATVPSPSALDVTLDWIWATAGLEARFDVPGSPFTLYGRCEGAGAWMRAAIPNGKSTPSGWIYGVREGLGATWWWVPSVGLTLGAEVAQTLPAEATVSDADGTRIPDKNSSISTSWISWSASIGLGFRTD